MGELAALDRRAGAPPLAVDDLLVGENGVLDRVPVNPGLAPIDKTGLEEIEKHLLFVPIVLRVTGGELARPVVGQTDALELPSHSGDVLSRPCRGVDAALHGGILGRQAERIPTHRMQHVEALRPLEPGDDVAECVVADVAHVDVPRRVWEHFKNIILRPRIIFASHKAPAFFPDRLPFASASAKL